MDIDISYYIEQVNEQLFTQKTTYRLTKRPKLLVKQKLQIEHCSLKIELLVTMMESSA